MPLWKYQAMNLHYNPLLQLQFLWPESLKLQMLGIGHPTNINPAKSKKAFRIKIEPDRALFSNIGAELQNLLKLFGALVDGRLSNAPSIPASLKTRELVIY
jgi:hypothetical protein